MTIWAFVPAGGVGTRMGNSTPKQYLPLGGREIIRHAIERLSTHPAVAGVVVGIADTDRHFPALGSLPVRAVTRAGPERAVTVLNGLNEMNAFAEDVDWVLVHDAARPLVRHHDIDRLIQACGEDGALLAMRVTDTVKFADAADRVERTVDRSRLWRAATPQMFRFGALRDGLAAALADGIPIPDESVAMERAGYRPHLVPCAADNIKITEPADLSLANWLLENQEDFR